MFAVGSATSPARCSLRRLPSCATGPFTRSRISCGTYVHNLQRTTPTAFCRFSRVMCARAPLCPFSLSVCLSPFHLPLGSSLSHGRAGRARWQLAYCATRGRWRRVLFLCVCLCVCIYTVYMSTAWYVTDAAFTCPLVSLETYSKSVSNRHARLAV